MVRKSGCSLAFFMLALGVIDIDGYDSMTLAKRRARSFRKMGELLPKSKSSTVDSPGQPASQGAKLETLVGSQLRSGLRPTQKLRFRSLANEIKEVLLPDHDPWKCQAQELIDAGVLVPDKKSKTSGSIGARVISAPLLDERTFQSWWLGERDYAWKKNIAACALIVPTAEFWLKNAHGGTSIQRHMDALDVKCDLRVPKEPHFTDGDWWSADRMSLLDKCMLSADRFWSVFSHRSTPSQQALGLFRQAGSGVKAQDPAFEAALARLQAASSGTEQDWSVSARITDVPESICHFHNAVNKFGLLQFLVRAGVALEDSRPWWYRDWVFDLASVAAMAQFYAVFGPGGSPASNLGVDADLIAVLNRVFYDHEVGIVTPLVSHLPQIANRLDLPVIALARALMAARREYYGQLAKLGIDFASVYEFAKPVELVGTPAVTGHIIWEGAPPVGWQGNLTLN